VNSALYRGFVRHRRFGPRPHAFTYRLDYLYLDLDELPQLFARRWFWSFNRRNLGSVHRRDYLPDERFEDLRDAVRARIREAGHPVPQGRICLLAQPRFFGHRFNPVVFFYCFDAQDELHTIVSEITNTPWGQRHVEVHPLAAGEPHRSSWHFRFAKTFHVSPFLPMDLDYDWRFTAPGDALRVHMRVLGAADDASSACAQASTRETLRFDATLAIKRRKLSAAALAGCLLRVPPMSIRIVLGIYWNALLIRLKGNPFHAHPESRQEPA
jgi:DUF1365 family protein